MLKKEHLPQITPTNHVPQDRYSLNLWRWARKKLRQINSPSIGLVVAFATEGKKEYDPTKTQASSLYIGIGNGFSDIDDGWLHGARLTEVLGNGVKAVSFAFPPRMKFVIVPDWWERYAAGGKCIIDPKHWLYGHERWQVSEDGQERTCIWCGNATQRLHTEMVPKTEWRNQ